MEKEKKPEFVVTDRRKFNVDGEPRPDVPQTETAAPPAPNAAPALGRLPSRSAAAAPVESDAQARRQSPASVPGVSVPDLETGYNGDRERTAFGGQKMEFIHLLDMLVQTAMMYAGAMESGTERRVDVVGLRQMIDLITVLEEKTKGNLTQQEAEILSNTMFQLRMTYMEIVNMIDRQALKNAPGAPGARPQVKLGTVTVLGSGTSMGVPTIGCDCAVCHSKDPHDRRTRPSVMIEWEGHRIVIDSGPDFREQAIREGITRLDAVLYTHGHADHILGLDDLRPLTYPRVTGGGRLPLYARPETAVVVQSVFKYVFDDDYKYGGIAQVELHEIRGPFQLLDVRVIPVPVIHGDAEILGYRIGGFGYLTDFSAVPEASIEMLKGVQVVILDALRHQPHPTHSTVENSLQVAERIGAGQTYFTHISHDLAHEATNGRCRRACGWPTTGCASRPTWRARVQIFESLEEIPEDFGPAVVTWATTMAFTWRTGS